MRSSTRLLDVIRREPVLEPWSEEPKIPWDDPEFSRRMLQEHLSQEHDAASRRSGHIAAHVDFIHQTVLSGRPSRILDLGCGPGLYTAVLAQLGHGCVGIDLGPASIDYARRISEHTGDVNLYVMGDVRTEAFGDHFDLVMMIFGEINVFRPEDARSILEKARLALAPGGMLLLEAHTWDAVRAMGMAHVAWRGAERGLFSDHPHLVLEESFWSDEARVAATRYHVVDAQSASVRRFGQCVQAYTDAEYRDLLSSAGFELRSTYASLSGDDDAGDFVVLLGSPH